MWDASGSQSSQDILARAFGGALGLLARRVAEPEFSIIVRSAFADDAHRKEIADALTDLLLAKSTPKLALVPAETLHGASGAYDAESDTIYVAQEFVASHASAVSAIERVLLEEIGHAIDARLGLGDSPGDEGAIFATLVMGEALPAAALAALKAEDDHGTIEVGGASAAVEFAAGYGTVTLDGNLGEWAAADRIDLPGFQVPGYELYGKLTGDHPRRPKRPGRRSGGRSPRTPRCRSSSGRGTITARPSGSSIRRRARSSRPRCTRTSSRARPRRAPSS